MPDARSIVVGNEELFTVRDAMRGLNRILEQMESGEIDKAVLTRKDKMIATIELISS